MTRRMMTAVVSILLLTKACGTAVADNQMGYRLQGAEQSASLRKAGGSLGMKVGPERVISSGGMTFELLRVEGIGASSPAEQAGLKVGDQIIAVDGRVFPNVPTFAEYVGSVPPGHRIEVDYMPAGGGPQQAQRVGVTVGEGGRAAKPVDAARGSLSTGEKIAIGAGAIAVFGCYEAGCFSRLKKEYDTARDKRSLPATAPQSQR